MLRLSFNIFGFLFVLIGCLLLSAWSLKSTSNQAELAYIRDHGAYSIPGAFQWSGWQPANSSIPHLNGSRFAQNKLPIAEFRRGQADGFLFDFVAYEGRSASANAGAPFPVDGPGWGAHYNSVWAIAALGLGIVLVITSQFVKQRDFANNVV